MIAKFDRAYPRSPWPWSYCGTYSSIQSSVMISVSMVYSHGLIAEPAPNSSTERRRSIQGCYDRGLIAGTDASSLPLPCIYIHGLTTTGLTAVGR
jgi:hypothetical protein